MKKTIEQMYNEKQERIEIRASKIDKNIAYFNSINSAIQMTNTDKSIKDKKNANWTEILVDWRDWFYQEWEKWYLKETTPQAINMKKAVALGDDWMKKREKRAESDVEFSNVKGELQEDEDIEKANRDLADIENNQPEVQAENQFREHNKSK